MSKRYIYIQLIQHFRIKTLKALTKKNIQSLEGQKKKLSSVQSSNANFVVALLYNTI